MTRWGPGQLRPTAVLTPEPATPPNTLLLEEEGTQTWYLGGRDLTLWSGDTAHHRSNLNSGRAQVWVALRGKVLRNANGADQVLAAGIASGELGVFTVHQNALAYVTFDRLTEGPAGPLRAPDDPSALWYWDLAGNTRTRLVETQRAITTLTP